MPKMDKTEERAYYVLVMSRGPFLMTTLAILFPIILDLAKFNRSKDGYVHLGMLSITPANFVFVVNSITSFIVIVLSPLIGSISDINNNRKKIVVAMSLAFMIVSFSSFFLLSKKLWLFCALIQITLISIFELTNVIYNAIMASIGKTDMDYNRLSSLATVFENVCLLVFLLITPFILHSGRTRNLITHGNFDYYDSFEPWTLLYNGKEVNCLKQKPNFLPNSPLCWLSITSGEHNVKDLTILIPEKGDVKLKQTTKIKSASKSLYAFTSIMSITKSTKEKTLARMIVIQKDENGLILRTTKSDKESLSTEKTLYEVEFKVDKNTKIFDFEIELESTGAVELNNYKIETLMPIDVKQISVIILSSLLFGIFSIWAVQYLRDRNEDGTISVSVALRRGVSDTYETFQHALNHKKTTLFIICNMLWYCAYIMLSLLMIVYLEDKHSIGSYNLSLLFFLMSVSIVVGALTNYFMRFLMKVWNFALIAYGLWMFLPFIIFLKFFDLPFYVSAFAVVLLGIMFGLVDAIKYSIYASLIPKNHEGKYMGLFFFGNRLMDFFANLMILLLLRVFKIETVISMTSILFFSSFSILAVIVFKGVENSPEDSVEVSQSEIDLSAS